MNYANDKQVEKILVALENATHSDTQNAIEAGMISDYVLGYMSYINRTSKILDNKAIHNMIKKFRKDYRFDERLRIAGLAEKNLSDIIECLKRNLELKERTLGLFNLEKVIPSLGVEDFYFSKFEIPCEDFVKFANDYKNFVKERKSLNKKKKVLSEEQNDNENTKMM